MAELTQEQRTALAEKLKTMSPEQLREFQKQQCLFCQIITKKVESKIIYEDESSLAILDINPASKGHILLLPKEHYTISAQIPPDVLGKLLVNAKKLSHAQLKGLKAHGTNVFIANGVAAGQKAQHVIVHLIPRMEKDGLLTLPQRDISEDDLKKLAKAITKQLAAEKTEKEPTPAPTKKREEKEAEPEKKPTATSTKPEKKPAKKQTQKQTKKKGDNVSLDDIADLFK